jgi:hypothetical protein
MIRARVTVQDEAAAAVPGALVLGRWTRPDGNTSEENASTDAHGLAILSAPASPGTHTLAIVNISLPLHTFDPGHSVLSNSLAVDR